MFHVGTAYTWALLKTLATFTFTASVADSQWAARSALQDEGTYFKNNITLSTVLPREFFSVIDCSQLLDICIQLDR